MLRHPDAAKISVPGRAYIQVGEDEIYEQVQSYWSGAPYSPERSSAVRQTSKISILNLSGARSVYEPEKTTGYRAEKNEVDAIVDHIDNYVRKNNLPRARRVWTEKLPDEIFLDEILTVAFDGEKWNSKTSGLYIPVGRIDDPRSQSQYPFRLAPHEDGHFALYGAPGTGKTTFLQTAVISAALSFPPEQVSIYIMDFAGGSMNIFSDLPHVGGIAVAGEDEKMDKLAKLLRRELEERKRKFSEYGVVNIDAYCDASGCRLPYVLLILDNFAPVLDMYPDLGDFFMKLTGEGGGYGMYLLVSTGGTMNLSYRIAQYIKAAASLRLSDRNDYSAIVGRTDGPEPANHPGRGLIRNVPPLEFQTALPALGKTEKERIASIRSLAARMNARWHGVRSAPIPVMPERITTDSIHSGEICVGLSTEDMSPVPLPIAENPFTVISGIKGSDTTGLFRAIVRQIREKMQDAEISLLASSSGAFAQLSDSADTYCSAGDEIDAYVETLVPELNRRREQYMKDNKVSFTPLFIAVNDLRTFFDAVSNDTIKRMTAVISLGRSLGVYMLIAGEPGDISNLYHGGESFTISIVNKAAALLLGGSFKDHPVFKADISYSESERKLSEREGYLLENGRLRKIRVLDD